MDADVCLKQCSVLLCVTQRGWRLCGTTMPVAVSRGNNSWRADTAARQCSSVWGSVWVNSGWTLTARTVPAASPEYRYLCIHLYKHRHVSTWACCMSLYCFRPPCLCIFTACVVVFTLQKDGGCIVMTCSRCMRMFCWSCLTKLSSHSGDGHFDDGRCDSYSYDF